MHSFGRSLGSTIVALGVSASLLAGCAHGAGGQSALPAAASGASAGKTVQSATATFTFTFPKPTASQARAAQSSRTPKYLSSATKSISLQVTDTKNAGDNSDIYGNVPAALKAVQVANFADLAHDGTVPGQCGTDTQHPSNYECTATFLLPVGINTITIASWDANGGTGNKLSQNIATVTTLQGVANGPTKPPALPNAYNVSLDGNAASISLSGTQPCTAGSITTQFGSGAGTSPVTINVSFTDPAGKTIVAPGQPKIQIQDNGGVWQSVSGTINATGGTVGFNINQSSQSFTLTPSTVPVTNATVNVRGVPPNADGLTFTQSHSFAFSASSAPPAHGFLGVVEQNLGGTTGQINFFNVTLGGSGANDTVTPYTNALSTTTLPSTNSINESAPDVDNPEAIVFDSGGNLLIANGGQGGAVTSYAPAGDYGNFACVPSGAIATGAALSTTNQTNLHVPDAIAVSSDGTVAVANNPASAAKNVQEFVLPGSGNYAVGNSFTNPGGYGVPLGRPLVNIPTLTAGTFAFTLFDGTNSKLIVLGPTGTTSTVTNSTDSHLSNPFAMAWDTFNNQLVVGDNNTPDGHKQSYLNFYTVGNPPSTPTSVKSFLIQQDPDPADDCAVGVAQCAGMAAQRIAVAPTSGYVAVAGINFYNSVYGGGEIQIYDSSHNPLANGVIAFDGTKTTSDPCNFNNDPNADYTYGESGFKFTELQWLSSTKLLVLVEQPNKTAVQGIYIYDVSVRTAAQTGLWGPYSSGSCHSTAIPTGPTQTYFQNVTSLVPYAATFKP